jgi:hypothetical protein
VSGCIWTPKTRAIDLLPASYHHAAQNTCTVSHTLTLQLLQRTESKQQSQLDRLTTAGHQPRTCWLASSSSKGHVRGITNLIATMPRKQTANAFGQSNLNNCYNAATVPEQYTMNRNSQNPPAGLPHHPAGGTLCCLAPSSPHHQRSIRNCWRCCCLRANHHCTPAACCWPGCAAAQLLHLLLHRCC